MIEATCIHEIPHQPLISLRRASHVISNAGYIINTDPRTIQNLIKSKNDKEQTLGNHTRPARFESTVEY